VGVGDDAAVLPPSPEPLLLTTDVLVEGTHFRREWVHPEEVGWKALAVNLSDAAAMGGVPRYAVVSLVLPPATRLDVVERLYRGMARLARREKVGVVGGNLARGKTLSVTLALVGAVPRGPALLRGGARPGDVIYVSGVPGLAHLGLRLLRRGGKSAALRRDPWSRAGEPAWRARLAQRSSWARRALRRFLRPDPRLAMAEALRAWKPSALIDVSDGLARDLRHLTEGGARLVIEPSRLPLPRGFRALAESCGIEAEEASVRGGEDYELLAALPPRSAKRLGPRAKVAGVPFTAIGEVRRGAAGVFVQRGDGFAPLELPGFDHFTR